MRQYVISENQNAILLAIARNGWGTHEHIHEAVFGVPFLRSERAGTLPGTERASLSRAVRRLESRRLICPKHRRRWKHADEGRAEMERQGVECRGEESDRVDELESQIAKGV